MTAASQSRSAPERRPPLACQLVKVLQKTTTANMLLKHLPHDRSDLIILGTSLSLQALRFSAGFRAHKPCKYAPLGKGPGYGTICTMQVAATLERSF